MDIDIQANPDIKFASGDVGAQRIAHTYAEALLNAASQQHREDEVVEELDGLVREVFARDPRLEALLSSHAIGRDQKAAVLRKAFEPRTSETFSNFLNVLNKHERLELLRPIRAAALAIRDERARRLRVHVRVAAPLPDDQRERLMQQLRAALQQEPILDIKVDPDLLGGLIVEVGDWLYDASVRTQLDILRNQLIERSSHEIQSRRDRFGSD